jgi:hypothetical protein
MSVNMLAFDKVSIVNSTVSALQVLDSFLLFTATCVFMTVDSTFVIIS